jgi:hypothetical protein
MCLIGLSNKSSEFVWYEDVGMFYGEMWLEGKRGAVRRRETEGRGYKEREVQLKKCVS